MLEIRRMTKEDLPEVAEIEADIFTMPWSAKGFGDAIENPYTLYLVALEDGKIAGYCGLWQSFEEADITNVAVREECRGRHTGTMMLDRLMELGKEQGITRFTLEVRSSNSAAVRLYEKLGFSSVGIRKRFYEKPVEDAVIMWN